MNYLEKQKQNFTERLNKIYKANWKDKGKSQNQFAQAINEVMEADGEEPNCRYQYVSKWLNGTIPDDKNLQYIAKVLDLPIEVFYPYYQTEKEDYDTNYRETKSNTLCDYAVDQGVDPSFLDYISKLNGIENDFPFDETSILMRAFRPVDDSIPLMRYQFTDNAGHRVMWNEKDIDFIKDLQDKIDKQIRFYMWEKKRDQEDCELKRHVEGLVHFYGDHFTEADVWKMVKAKTDWSKDPRVDSFYSKWRELDKAVHLLVREMNLSPRVQTFEEYMDMYSILLGPNVSPETHIINRAFGGQSEEELEAFYQQCQEENTQHFREGMITLIKDGLLEKDALKKFDESKDQYIMKRGLDNGKH